MTFRPGPSPLGGPRPGNSKKDGGERGQHLEKTGTNQGEGNHARVRRPSRQLYNGTEGDSRGSHFGAVTSGQSPHCQSASATRFQPLPLSGRRNSSRRHNVSVMEVCSILPCHPPPPVIRPADHALPVLKFRSKSKLQVRVEDGIYHLVPSVQAGTRDHR